MQEKLILHQMRGRTYNLVKPTLHMRLRQYRCIMLQHEVQGASKGAQAFAAAHTDARQLIGGLRVLDGGIEGERIERGTQVSIIEQIG